LAKLKNPIRMCISCRNRKEQNLLLRLQCKDYKLLKYDGFGRSFYICEECQDKTLQNIEIKKIKKALFRECKKKDEYIVQLKEILTHVR